MDAARGTDSDSPCPGADSVLSYLAGHRRRNASRFEHHVDGCDECRLLLAKLARTSLGDVAQSTGADGDPAPLGDYLPAGAMVDRYRVTRVLGSGGMGVVYEAEDTLLQRPVAIKVLRTSVTDFAGPRLLSEARAMGRLAHPNVRAIFHVGAVDGRYYLAMERIDGDTLTAWLRERTTVTEIVDAFVAAGEGLVAAHAIGIVHRDFKPDNVLVEHGGRVVVCDFGLATEDRDPRTEVAGTPHYMAPEQYDGEADARVDQYAFGVALHDALRGAAVSSRLERVVVRASAEDPRARFETMQALLQALRGAVRPGRQVWVATAVLGATLGGSLAAGLAGATVQRPPASAARPAPPQIDPAVERWLAEAKRHDARGDYEAMGVAAERALAEARARGDRAGGAVGTIALAGSLALQGDRTEAVELYQTAFFEAAQIGRDDIAADAAAFVINAFAKLGRAPQALSWGRHAEGMLQRMGTLDAGRAAAFDMALGSAHYAAGDLPSAVDRLEQAVARLRNDSANHSANPSANHDQQLAGIVAAYAGLLFNQGDYEGARVAFEEAAATTKRLYGADHPEHTVAVAQLAIVLAELGELDQALERLREARAATARTLGADHPDVLGMEDGIGKLLLRQGKMAQAREILQAALPRVHADDPVRCSLLERLGQSWAWRDACDQAAPYYRQAASCWVEAQGADSQRAAEVTNARTECEEREPPF
ncbi:MAG: serine/threonine-protein kinase [Myxococcota bacterium]